MAAKRPVTNRQKPPISSFHRTSYRADRPCSYGLLRVTFAPVHAIVCNGGVPVVKPLHPPLSVAVGAVERPRPIRRGGRPPWRRHRSHRRFQLAWQVATRISWQSMTKPTVVETVSPTPAAVLAFLAVSPVVAQSSTH